MDKKTIKEYIAKNKGVILNLGHGDKTFYVVKRLFTAKNMPDEKMRTTLNENVETSEYMPSEKYAVVDDLKNENRKFSAGFRTKTEAVEWIANYFNT